jgi:hypothetical protein
MKYNLWPIIFLLIYFPLDILSQSDRFDALDDMFEDYEILRLDASAFLDTINSFDPNDQIRMRFLGWQLILEESGILSDRYKSYSFNGEKSSLQNMTSAKALNGYTEQGGRVSLTINHNFIQGFIRTAMFTFYIEPVYHFDKYADRNLFVFYNTKDIKPGKEMNCGVTDEHRIPDDRNMNPQERDRNHRTGECFEVEYAIASDWLMFDHYGSVSAVENHNIAVTNDMQTNYTDDFADEVQFVIVEQFIVNTAGGDPWTNSTSASALLNSFTNWGPGGFSTTHDLGSIWTKRNFDGTTIGIAWLNAVCTSIRYNALQDFSNNANLKRVLLAHEVGHNFNADHDASGSQFIMAPSVQNTNLWSTASITAIENHYNSRWCLDGCSPSTPEVNFLETQVITAETGAMADTSYCESPYKTITIPVRLNRPTTASSVIEVEILSGSTASSGLDFELLTPTLNFPSGSANTQNILINIIDDAIQEDDETILLKLNHISGPAEIGLDDECEITIIDGLDVVNDECCSPGGFVQYGNYNWNAALIFFSYWEDARTRVLFLPSQLDAAGITEGYITGLAVYVQTKNSSQPYIDFRVGMKNTNFTSLLNQEWIDTDEVFLNSYSTVQGTWNVINFDSPFYWDGTSSLYIQFCFDNASYSTNDDIIRGTNPLSDPNNRYHEWRRADNTIGCELQSTTLNYNEQDIQPQMRFYQFGGAIVENTLNKNSKSHIKVGETAHLYSDERRIVASVKNMGSTDIECIEARVQTSGNGKNPLPFGGGDYSAKTIEITADNDAIYELTLYYTPAQMSTWGNNADRLNIIKSTGPISSATLQNSIVIRPDTIFTGLGNNNAYVYKGVFNGFSSFALTDRTFPSEMNIHAGDFVLEQNSSGILFQTWQGEYYRLAVNSSGNIIVSVENNPIATAELIGKEMYLEENSKGVVLRTSGGNYRKLAVNNSGQQTLNTISLPANHVVNTNGNYRIVEPGGSIVLRNGNGECFRFFINESGQLRHVKTLCP